MFEPISAISFSFACLSLLVAGFSDLDKKRRLASKYKERLERYQAFLDRCKINLQLWDETWVNFDEEDYQLFFGESRDTITKLKNNVTTLAASVRRSIYGHEKGAPLTSEDTGADDSKKWLTNLKKLARNIGKLIPGSYPSERDWETWQEITANNVIGQDKKLEVMKRVTFALFQDQMLSDNIGQLEKGIETLRENSQHIFNKRFERDDNAPIKRSYLEKTKTEAAFLKLISGFANNLFEAQRQAREAREAALEGDRWNLELRVPDGYGDVKRCDLLEVVKLDFAIQTRSPENGWGLPRRVRLKYDTKQNPPAEAGEVVRLAIGTLNVSELETARRQQLPSDNVNNENEGILEKLGPASRLSLPFKDIFQQGVLNDKNLESGWRQEQAQLLQGLVNWMLLLWNTNWTLNPYCCRIHFESLSNDEKRHVLITEMQHDCRGSEHLHARMLSLGLTFAEIILATPLKLSPLRAPIARSHPHPPIESLSQHILQRWDVGYHGVEKWIGTSEGKIIQDVAHKAGERVADAIKACLDFPVPTTDSEPGFFNFFREQILKPLDKYCKESFDHQKRLDGIPWAVRAKNFWPPDSVFIQSTPIGRVVA